MSIPSTAAANRSTKRAFVDLCWRPIDLPGDFEVSDFDPKIPYNDLPELPPPTELIETTEILKKCINARVALRNIG